MNERLKRIKEFLNSGTHQATLANVALCVLAVASMPMLVLIAASMGNAVQIFRQFKTSKNYNEEQIKSSLNHLQRQKFIEYVKEKNGKTIIRITKKGETKLHAFDIELMKINKPKRWDGKWRLVMFDIPMRFTKGREALRYHLKELDFLQFQKSAWIYPYPCEEEIIFIADFYGIGKYVEVLIVESLLRDKKFKGRFHLSNNV